MIRLLFVLFVTLGGFAALALWNFRSDGEAQPIVSPELRTTLAAEVERLGLPKLADKLPTPKRALPSEPADSKPEPRPARAKTPERATPTPVAAAAPGTSTVAVTTAPRGSDESAHSGAGGSVTAETSDEEPLTEVEVIVPRAEFARDFGPADDRGVEIASDALAIDEADPGDRPDWDDGSRNHDADRSARLIRRMLAVYRSSGAGR